MSKSAPKPAPAPVQSGFQTLIPLDRLLKSPDNARKTPHSAAALASLRASIAAKGILQNLIVRPERDDDGAETGFYYVTAGEGRRLAQIARAKDAEIPRDTPIPCVIRETDDAREISLDENVTREAMHPADQFEAFRALNVTHGMDAADIAARFGVSAHTVRQRLRLGALSPLLMQAYRDEKLTLTQLMAYTVTEDRVDFHPGSLAKGLGLSTILALGDRRAGAEDNELTRALREAAGRTFNETGQKIVQQAIDAPATITVRPGWPVRIILTDTLSLENAL